MSTACDGTDCDDQNAAIHPQAAEGPFDDPVCSDGLDNDCDGLTDGNAPDCEPPTPDGPDLIALQADTFSTDSVTFVDVPGGTLTFEPVSSDQVWLVLLSARLLSDSLQINSLQARYLVNGTEQGLGGGMNQVVSQPFSWQHFCWVTGTVEEQVVSVQLRDEAGTGTIAGLRLVALALPEGADPHFAENPAVQNVTSVAWEAYLQFSFTPVTPGEYLVLALMIGNEAPGTGNLFVQVQGPGDGDLWPQTPFVNHRGNWLIGMWMRAMHLAREQQLFRINARGSSGVGSQMRDARMLAFRTDSFEQIPSVFDLQEITTDSDQPVVVSILQIPALQAERDFIVFQNLFSKPVLEDPDLVHACHAIFRLDEQELAHCIRYNSNSGPHASAGVFHALTTSGPVVIENVVQSVPAEMTMQAGESAIIVLGMP